MRKLDHLKTPRVQSADALKRAKEGVAASVDSYFAEIVKIIAENEKAITDHARERCKQILDAGDGPVDSGVITDAIERILGDTSTEFFDYLNLIAERLNVATADMHHRIFALLQSEFGENDVM